MGIQVQSKENNPEEGHDLRTASEKHSVPESLFGYIAQLNIALDFLAVGEVDTYVGVETLDDIAVNDPSGQTLAQSKMSLSRNPLTDSSSNFWGTLRTWMDIVDTQECNLTRTTFLFISNFTINTGLIAQLKAANTQNEFELFIADLKTAAKKLRGDCKAYAESVLHDERSDVDLIAFFRRIRVVDAYPANPESQNAQLAKSLNLVSSIAKDVIQGLRGWVQEKVQDKLAKRQPAWLDRNHFCEECYRLIARYHDRKLYLRSVRDFTITSDERLNELDATFVRQLRLVGISDEDDDFLEAINDYLMSCSERTRLSSDTGITRKSFEEFEDRLVARWRPFHNSSKRANMDPLVAGYEVLTKVLDHREMLAGHPTDEYYFTRGAYHQLANATQDDDPRLGWHPNFKELV